MIVDGTLTSNGLGEECGMGIDLVILECGRNFVCLEKETFFFYYTLS